MNEDNVTRLDRATVTERIVERDTGVYQVVIAILFVMLTCSIVGMVYYARNPKDAAACAQNNVTIRAQADAEKAKADFGVSIQKRIDTMQMEVAKFCIANKGVPVLLNGNVDCKK